MDDKIKWYEAKLVWVGIIMTVLGILPLVNVFVQVVAPQAVTVVEAVCALVAGILTVVWRVWSTNTRIETPPVE